MAPTTRRALLAGTAALALTGAVAAVPSAWDRLIAQTKAHGDPAITTWLLKARRTGASIDQLHNALRRSVGWNEVQAAYVPDHEDWPDVRATAEWYGFEAEEVEGFYTTRHGPDAGRLSLVLRRAATGEVSHISRDGRVS